LIEEARRQHVDLEIRPVKRDEISMAEALYLTNALIGVQPVKRCEDRLFDVDRPTPAPLERVDRLALCALSEPKAG
jgi:branched-subunit amino acid aminotransferase/4-amino-4-deoxychorismate lyase